MCLAALQAPSALWVVLARHIHMRAMSLEHAKNLKTTLSQVSINTGTNPVSNRILYDLQAGTMGCQNLPDCVRSHALAIGSFKDQVQTNAARDCYINVYVDDLLVLGDKTTVDSTFEAIQKVLLTHVGYLGYLEPGKPPSWEETSSASATALDLRTPTST